MVLSKVFQETGWVAMETAGLKFTSTIQLQAKPETVFTSHNVSSETTFVDSLILFNLIREPLFSNIIFLLGCHIFFPVLLFVTPSPLLPCNVLLIIMKLFMRSVCLTFHGTEILE